MEFLPLVVVLVIAMIINEKFTRSMYDVKLAIKSMRPTLNLTGILAKSDEKTKKYLNQSRRIDA